MNCDCTLMEKMSVQDSMEQRIERAEWDDEDTLQLIELARAGKGSAEISKIMRRTQASVNTKASRICLHIKGLRSDDDIDPAKQTPRRCMPCQGWMASTHIGQRICAECKKTYAYRSA